MNSAHMLSLSILAAFAAGMALYSLAIAMMASRSASRLVSDVEWGVRLGLVEQAREVIGQAIVDASHAAMMRIAPKGLAYSLPRLTAPKWHRYTVVTGQPSNFKKAVKLDLAEKAMVGISALAMLLPFVG